MCGCVYDDTQLGVGSPSVCVFNLFRRETNRVTEKKRGDRGGLRQR